MDEGKFQASQMNSPIELGTNNEAGPAEGTGFSRKEDKIPKRKKHRPKVVKEKKITKIQKYTTAKPAKEKETRSTGKRKYVRKKGLNATTNQPPAEDSDMQNRAEKIKARRSLKFNEDDRRKNADLASQAQVTEASFNPEDPRSSIYAAERTHARVACHWGGTSSSINANPKAFTREAVTMDGFSVQGDGSSFATNQNNHNEASFGLHNSYDFPHILAPVGNQREHSAVNGPMVSLDTSFVHSNSSRTIHNDPHSSSSRGSYLTETCQQMRSESQKNQQFGAVGEFSSSSAHLPSKWNTNEVSATNSGAFTLADVQRSLALDKSRCHQRMISSGISELIRVQQHNQPTLSLCDTSDTVFVASPDKQSRYINSLGGNNVLPNT